MNIWRKHKWAVVAVLVAVAITFAAMQWHGSRKYAAKEEAAKIALAKVETEREHLAEELATINGELVEAKAKLEKKTKELNEIKIKYAQARDSIRHLPFNQRLELFAKRVSQGAFER